MKKITASIALGILSMANSVNAADALPGKPAEAAARAGNLFAVDLYSQVKKTDGNICISPYSVGSALDMAVGGAVGKTAEQMLTVLHWTNQAGDLPPAATALTDAIQNTNTISSKDDSQITIANALFGQRGYPYHRQFLDLLANQYAAALQEVDFATQPQQACEQINRWAVEKTRDRIKHAVAPSVINSQTRLVLVDAIYFKGAWQDTFSKAATEDLAFFQGGNDSTNVPTMRQSRSLPYMENQLLQTVELPYQGDFSMVVLLPKQRDGLAGLEKSLTSTSLTDWLNQLSPQLLQVYLPRFRVEGEYSLTGVLRDLGMTDAFDANTADFSGIVSSGKLNIDQVIHKTYISVDEAGTEAAAVTSITMRATAMPAPRHEPEPVIFRADHPFLFVLRHRSTGAILFIGRISNPN